ncbi:MAG: flap endonuclease [Chloroflexota bacterium]|nr:flap endonuclease [Chloroflexota bacterium]
MKVHLVDGTYELFRAHFALPSISAPDGREVGAVRGLLQTLINLLRQPEVSHVAVAFDTEILSFRNQLFEGYKTGEGTPPELLAQFPLAERAASALGLVVWPMTEFEADDALGTAAVRWQDSPGVEQIVLCSPDKDLAQVVRGDRVVTLDRRREIITDENGVREKFGVSPASIPDYLGLVGDSADGIPGIPRWGAKGTAQVLDHYGHIEHIPPDAADWAVNVRGAKSLATSLAQNMESALLYRHLATLRLDVPIVENVADLEWQGAPQEPYQALSDELGFGRLRDGVGRWREG